MNDDISYRTLGNTERAKITRKGSRFIGVGVRCRNETELEAARGDLEDEFPDATHICSGSVILKGGRPVERYDNDGEPSGTAGEPILDVLKGSGLKNCCLFVVRYYGGTNLGTGGLVRAYSDTARRVLEKSTVVLHRKREEVLIRFAYPLTGTVTEILAKFDGAEVVDRDYDEAVTLRISIPVEGGEALKSSLIESSSNRVNIINGG